MRMPAAPPDVSLLIPKVVSEKLTAFASQMRPTDQKHRYLHWDELMHRDPPEGLTHEEWWAAMKLSRGTQSQPVPLLSKAGRAFAFCETAEVRRSLHVIDSDARASVRVDRPVTTQGAGDYYIVRSLVEEPYSSSVLEGAATTRKIAKEMIEGLRQPRNVSERMVLNNYHAMRLTRQLKDQPLTPEMILDIHTALTVDTLESPGQVGRLRTDADKVVVEDQSTGEVLHVPPAASELNARLQRLCAFANQPAESEPFVHPIVRAIVLHFMIGYDHPFVDGNGRTARALFYWSALRSGYWLLEFASISKAIRSAPARYGAAYLHTETDAGDLTYFLIHQLEMILRSLKALNEYLARKTKELRDLETLVRNADNRHRFNDRQIRLLEEAIRKPGTSFTIEDHRKRAHVSYLTARSDLESLHKMKLLGKRQSGTRSIYTSSEKILSKLGLDKSAA